MGGRAKCACTALSRSGMIPRLTGSAGSHYRGAATATTLADITADLERAFAAANLSDDVIRFVRMAAEKKWPGQPARERSAGSGSRPGQPLGRRSSHFYRCLLHCAFCYNPTDFANTGAELGTGDRLRVLREARVSRCRAAGAVRRRTLVPRRSRDHRRGRAPGWGSTAIHHHFRRGPERCAPACLEEGWPDQDLQLSFSRTARGR